MGPWIRTNVDEDEIVEGLQLSARVNGVDVQRGDTRDVTFRPSELFRFLSRHMTMMPGDVISSGTPPRPERVGAGDLVELVIEGIGRLDNVVVEA